MNQIGKSPITVETRIAWYKSSIAYAERMKKQAPEIYAQRHYDRLIGINQKLLQRLK